jgi:FkbM family methyltransferase
MNKHFIDAGANIGQTLDWLARTPRFDGWKVWCIEPSIRHLAALASRANEYAERYEIAICPFGLGARSGWGEFFPKSDPLGDSFDVDSWTDHEQHNLALWCRIFCGVVGIADFLRQIPDPEELVLKLDVEGAEYDILPALLESPELRKVTEILVEFHNVGRCVEMDSEQLIRAFDARGIAIDMWSCK